MFPEGSRSGTGPASVGTGGVQEDDKYTSVFYAQSDQNAVPT